jgi:hypothetical protein
MDSPTALVRTSRCSTPRDVDLIWRPSRLRVASSIQIVSVNHLTSRNALDRRRVVSEAGDESILLTRARRRGEREQDDDESGAHEGDSLV